MPGVDQAGCSTFDHLSPPPFLVRSAAVSSGLPRTSAVTGNLGPFQ